MDIKLSTALDNLQAQMFELNKLGDKVSNLLLHRFSCIKFYNIFHEDFAHFWAFKAADKVVEIKNLAGTSSNYPTVKGVSEEFDTLESMFSYVYDAVSSLQDNIHEVIDIAEAKKEKFVQISLEDLILKIQHVEFSIKYLYEKSIQYGSDVKSFDEHAPNWYIRIFDVL